MAIVTIKLGADSSGGVCFPVLLNHFDVQQLVFLIIFSQRQELWVYHGKTGIGTNEKIIHLLNRACFTLHLNRFVVIAMIRT